MKARFYFGISSILALYLVLVACAQKTDSAVILGTSAQPPTYAHGLLMVKLEDMFKTNSIVLAPTRPYKEGVEKGDVALELASVMVDHFNEVLRFAKTSYRNFIDKGRGQSQYQKSDGSLVTVKVSPLEFLEEHKNGDTLYFLPLYKKIYAGGNPRELYWISGADSFESITSWTPRWKELFLEATWVVVMRKGYEGKIEAAKTDPLRGVLDDEWLSKNYVFEQIDPNEHRYRNVDKTKPDIVLVNVDIPAVSSTEVRSLMKEDNQTELTKLIPPAVLNRLNQCGYYLDKPTLRCEPLLLPAMSIILALAF